MKKIIGVTIISSGIVLTLSGCGSTSPASQTTSNSENTTANPLDTSANKDVCTSLRFIYAKNATVLSDWSNQAATDSDLEKALKDLGDNFSGIGMTASGDLSSVTQQMGTLFKKARVAATSGDSAGVLADITAVLPLATSFDNDCKSIDVN